MRSLWRPLPNPNTVGIAFELSGVYDFADSGPKVKSQSWPMDSRSLSDSAICQQLKRTRGRGSAHLEPDHSCRSAVVGSTPLARKAGTKPANPAATVRTIAEPMNVNGSRGSNP